MNIYMLMTQYQKWETLNKLSKLEEYIKRAIEILKSKESGYFIAQGSRTDDNDWLGRLIAILTDKHGGFNIPLEKVDEIAEAVLPDMVAYFESEEGKQAFAQWQENQKSQTDKEAKKAA